jgi:signal transduction histidine kinase
MIVSEPSPSSHILAVDDAPDNLFLLETILDTNGYDLDLADNGQEALSKITQKTPDLILLDIMMPGMNGFEVTRRVRQNESLPYIPILLITAHDQVSLVEGLDAGADDFIRKPFNVEELQARVRSLLRLKQALDTQSRMIRQRDEYVARLTHDLRTPLMAATRMLKFCQEEAFGQVAHEAKRAIAETIKNNDQLLEQVNTLLEVYGYESGHKALSFQPLNLYTLVAKIVQELQPWAAAKKLSLELIDQQGYPIKDPTPYRMAGDADELDRAIRNLVTNALKFTEQGSVQVQLQRSDQVPQQVSIGSPTLSADAWLILKVIDTGMGISAEERDEIFDWFRSSQQRRSNSGLGLHLGHRIVTRHGGWIEVDSAIGEGSTFTLYLPVQMTSLDSQQTW